MNQLDYFPLPHPCRGQCHFNHRSLCQTCFLDREEHAHWHNADDREKRAILRRSQQRRLTLQHNARRARQARRKRPVQQFELFADAHPAAHYPYHAAPCTDDDHPQLALFPELGKT